MDFELLTFQEHLPAFMRKLSIQQNNLNDEFWDWLSTINDYGLYWTIDRDGGPKTLVLSLSEENAMLFKLVWA